jgi:hypothetical protein
MSVEGMFAWKVPALGGIAGLDFTKPNPIRNDPSLWLVSWVSPKPGSCIHLTLSIICPLCGALGKKLKRGVFAHETLSGAGRRRSPSRILCSSVSSPSPEHASRRRGQSRNGSPHASPVGALPFLVARMHGALARAWAAVLSLPPHSRLLVNRRKAASRPPHPRQTPSFWRGLLYRGAEN